MSGSPLDIEALLICVDSFYATKEERRKTAKREYENQMVQRAHLQGLYSKNDDMYIVADLFISLHRQV